MKTKYFWMKIGRNDLCPCGSGKKFKKCCLDKPYEPSAELESDFELGQRLIAEFDAEQKMNQLRANLVRDLPKSYSPFEDTPEYHESFV